MEHRAALPVGTLQGIHCDRTADFSVRERRDCSVVSRPLRWYSCGLPQCKQEFSYPVELDEPDTSIEVGYSKDREKPLHIVFKHKEIELTLGTYKLFVFFYEQYRKMDKTRFSFEEISEGLTGDDSKMGRRAIGGLIYRLAGFLSKIHAPFTVRHNKEILYVCPQK